MPASESFEAIPGYGIRAVLSRKLSQVWFTRTTFALLLATGLQAALSGM
ncbi:hypothetical protein [Paenibacillus sp. GCM10012303]